MTVRGELLEALALELDAVGEHERRRVELWLQGNYVDAARELADAEVARTRAVELGLELEQHDGGAS